MILTLILAVICSLLPQTIGLSTKHLFLTSILKPSNTINLPLNYKYRDSALKFKNFDDMLENIEVPVLVDFYAQWCGPCVMMQPVLEDVAGRLDAIAKVAKVDTDKSPRLASTYQVEALPTLILFNKGQVIERFVGYRNADTLEAEVRKARFLKMERQSNSFFDYGSILTNAEWLAHSTAALMERNENIPED
eukprot:gene8589-11604_t